MRVLILSPYGEALTPAVEARGDTAIVYDGTIDSETLQAIDPDWIVSYGYRALIRQPVLDRFPGRIINLHISLLPWNRGADPNFWSWFEDTPKGVSIHLIDAGMDTGPILAQRAIEFDPLAETLASSYSRLRSEIETLFCVSWAGIATGKITPRDQSIRLPVHRMADKSGIFDQLPVSWGTRVCIVKRLNEIARSSWTALGNDQTCPCPLGPCALADIAP